MKLSLDQLFQANLSGFSRASLEKHEEKIPVFLERFAERKQGFVTLPKLGAQVLAVKKLAEELKGKFETIAILGIGGSALGIRCLSDALNGQWWNQSGSPRLFVLDNLDVIPDFERAVNLDKTLFIVISKSGTTPETMAQYFYFREKVSSRNFVFITDPEEGELLKIGREENIPLLAIPSNVGGRFSILTAVGLFPAALMGMDIDELLKGAEEMADSFKQREFAMNLPFQVATVQYVLDWEFGIHIHVLMPYLSRLATFSDWYAQLLAESLGKDGKGLTPVKALGVTDQHSQLQLYNEGPTDKLIIFLNVERFESPKIPAIENEKMSYLSGLSFEQLLHLEMEATEASLTEYKKPNIRLQIPELNEKTLGQLFMLFECSVAFLGEYYSINAFDQPGVELGKRLTKERLLKSRSNS